MPDPGSGYGRRYACLYRAALAFCWIGGGITTTAAGLRFAQWFPAAQLAVWITVTAVLAIAVIMFSDRVADAWARAVLTRFHGDCS